MPLNPPWVMNSSLLTIQGMSASGLTVFPMGSPPLGTASVVTIPSSVTGLVVWFDATQILGVSSGASLSAWTDLSGSASHATQAAAGTQPVYLTSDINNLASVSFGSSSAQAMAFISNSCNTVGSIFVVFKPYFAAAESTPERGILSRSRVGAGTLADLQKRTVANRLDWQVYTGGTTDVCQVTNLSWTTNSTQYWMVDYDLSTSASSEHAYHTSSLTSTAGGSNLSPFETNGIMRIGKSDTALFNSNFSGSFGEIAIYDRLLSASQRTTIDSYFTTKWSPT